MSVVKTKDAFIAAAAQQISLGQMFSITASRANPSYLVLTALDRNEYTAGATGATGHLSGNGQTANFGNLGGDARSVGVVFTYDASTGRYYNTTYGYLDRMTYTASGSLNDLTSFSLFGFGSLSQASAWANNPYALMSWDSAGYLGSAAVATQPSFPGTAPAQATPGSIASIAAKFVGDAWNMDGCWVLASTIAAEAGAALPMQSTVVGLPGRANGEWMVAFNGPAGQSGDWRSMVTEGDVVVIAGPSGNGHITTCVSGSGASAMLIDNVTYVGANGQIVNSANDGSSSDITIAAPHLASTEWAGVQAQNVVTYRLDTPVVRESEATANLATRASLALQPIFSATDPFNKAITEYQIYDTATSDGLRVSGTAIDAHSSGSAETVTSLNSVCLVAGAGTCTDTVSVRAFNGSYWGDWRALTVSVVAPSAPTLAKQTTNQTWGQGSRVAFTLPSGTFVDPQGEKLTYAAAQANGQALPPWLTFNPTTRTFSGAVPSGPQTLSLTVKATDTSGLSAFETFRVIVGASAPTVASPTADQTWTAGRKIFLALSANTFADPQGERLSYTVTQADGRALPRGLVFNAATRTLSGTAPVTPETLRFKVTATDASGLSASETFSATVRPAPPALAHQTASRAETAGQSMSFLLPKGTFSDPQGSPLTYAAFETSGADETSWLRFDPSTADFTGVVPTGASGTIGIRVVATDAYGLSASETFGLTFGASGSHLSMIPCAPSPTEALPLRG